MGGELRVLGAAQHNPRDIDVTLGRGDWIGDEEPANFTPTDGVAAATDEETSTMSITGELITEAFEYGGGREVTVYVPPEPPVAVVFAGDGQLISQWGGVLEAANVQSTMIVGAHRLADETLRLHEYSPVFDPKRFAAHA